jgi:hypothetical protein
MLFLMLLVINQSDGEVAEVLVLTFKLGSVGW